MGSMYILGFVEAGMTDIEQLVGAQLQGNHFPPTPKIMNPVAVRAVKQAIKAEVTGNASLYKKNIKLPKGVKYRNRPGGMATVAEVVESFHLGDVVCCLARIEQGLEPFGED